MSPRVAIVAGEEYLGVQQQCRVCGDWWPYHTDFFFPMHHCNRLASICRACYRDVQNAQQRARRARRHAA